MNPKTFTMVLLAVVLAGAGGYVLYRLGIDRGMTMAAGETSGSASGPAAKSASQKAGEVEPTTGKKVLYWHDPMVPGQKFDKPGKSPFMDMQLVPVYADGGDESAVAISARVQQNLGVRTVEVKQGSLASAVEAVGSVGYNERDVAVVQARANGFLERLYVRAPLDPVRKGQPLAELYVPDWVAAKEEYLSAKRIGARSDVPSLAGIADAAEQRMRLPAMSDAEIASAEAGGPRAGG